MLGKLRVVCAGIPRSGSTWLYNASRILLEICNKTPVYGSWIDDYDPDNPTPSHVVKVHEPNVEIISSDTVIITSRRDLRDIAASIIGQDWVDSEVKLLTYLEGVVAQHRWWSKRCNYEVVYEHMIANRRSTVAELASALGLNCGEAMLSLVDDTVDAMSYNESGTPQYDPTNLLHRQHRLDGRQGYYREVLSEELVQEIESRFSDWLSEYGYIGQLQH